MSSMDPNLPLWAEKATALPLAFAQVREDPLQDLWVVNQFAQAGRIIMVASGGCTAALLATSPKVAFIHLVDPNPAQLALARLKLRLLNAPTAERLPVLGHEEMPAAERRARLVAELGALGAPPETLGPIGFVAEVGPDRAGRYELLFAYLTEALRDRSDEIRILLRLSDAAEQARRVAPETDLGRALDAALDQVMALPILVHLFGEGATRNPVEPFARHFARRIRHALATLPAADNPYLWQMLASRFPPGVVSPWLAAPVTTRLPAVTWSNSFMAAALAERPGEYDFVHLSNILDWLSPEEAERTLNLAHAALRPGGFVLIRQLNSTLDIRAAGKRFDWLAAESDMLHAKDRSFFYRALHLGRRR